MHTHVTLSICFSSRHRAKRTHFAPVLQYQMTPPEGTSSREEGIFYFGDGSMTLVHDVLHQRQGLVQTKEETTTTVGSRYVCMQAVYTYSVCARNLSPFSPMSTGGGGEGSSHDGSSQVGSCCRLFQQRVGREVLDAWIFLSHCGRVHDLAPPPSQFLLDGPSLRRGYVSMASPVRKRY